MRVTCDLFGKHGKGCAYSDLADAGKLPERVLSSSGGILDVAWVTLYGSDDIGIVHRDRKS